MGVLDFYEQELPRLVGFLRQSVQDDAEDIAAEAFLRSWLAERQGQTIHPSFVYRVARNLVADQQRHTAYVARRLAAYLAEHPLTDPGPESRLTSDRLDGLSPGERVVIERRLRGDLLREIGDDLGIAKITVQHRQSEALKKLRREEDAALADNAKRNCADCGQRYKTSSGSRDRVGSQWVFRCPHCTIALIERMKAQLP